MQISHVLSVPTFSADPVPTALGFLVNFILIKEHISSCWHASRSNMSTTVKPKLLLSVSILIGGIILLIVFLRLHECTIFKSGCSALSLQPLAAQLHQLVMKSENVVATEHSQSPMSLWDLKLQPSVLVVWPRSAFFLPETPPWNGSVAHCDNATVMLLVIRKTALQDNVVTGCESEGYKTRNVAVKSFKQNGWVHEHEPWLTHDEAIATCCNLPVKNGSTTFILYKDKVGHENKIKTERDLYIPSKQPAHFNNKKSDPSIVVCVTVYGKPPWLRQWLLYQKTIGVDHIYMYAQQSFINEGSANDTILQQYLDTNYATLDVWPTYLNNSQVYYYQQTLLYNDCINRQRNKFDYAFFIDVDDFFVPVVPGKIDIHYYVQTLFSNEKVASVNILWTLFHSDCGLTQDPSTMKDGNMTRYLVNKRKDKRKEYIKSIHKLSAVYEVGVHRAYSWVSNQSRKWIPMSLAYIANIRSNSLEDYPDACNKVERNESINNVMHSQ